MDLEVILAIVAFGIGVIVTPIYILLFVKGVRTLRELRDVFGRPPQVGARARKSLD
jgi:hypothetical protein